MRIDDVYGDRSDRHQRIMLMTKEELHAAHPFTATLTFNTSMTKKEFSEKKIPAASTIAGIKKDGKPHAFCVGNEQGEILPKFLLAKLIVIESRKVYGNPLTIEVDDDEKDRLFAMVREAQHRGIQPLAIKEEKKARKRSRDNSEPVD